MPTASPLEKVADVQCRAVAEAQIEYLSEHAGGGGMAAHALQHAWLIFSPVVNFPCAQFEEVASALTQLLYLLEQVEDVGVDLLLR